MTFNIAIIDYGMGNLKSIYKYLKYLNTDTIITDNPRIIDDADGVIIPGVGAFIDAMKRLNEKNLIEIIHQITNDGKPIFGICLGLQILLSKSFEMGETEGLNIIKGIVVALDKLKVEKVPQIGWNNVKFQSLDHFLVQGIENNSFFYFVHSFYGIPEKQENILGLTEYRKLEFCSMVCKDNVVATQFHSEKSSINGIKIYQNFLDFCKK